jgi:hypothetical protein
MTTLQLDNQLVLKAFQLGKHKTEEAAVNQALAEYIERLQQAKILELFGQIDYDPAYDYKEQRNKK